MSTQMQNNDVVTSGVSADVSRVTGRVKWFNNKAGYGFVTVADGPHAGDVFVHHSAINVSEEQYRYLVQGEYVEFECVPVENGPHQWQASHVTGPNSGPMMCETRRVVRSIRTPPGQSGVEQAGEGQDWQLKQSRRQSRQSHMSSEVDQEQSVRRRRPYQGQGGPVQQGQGVSYRGGAPGPSSRGPNGEEYEWLLVRKHPQGSRPPVRHVRRHVPRNE